MARRKHSRSLVGVEIEPSAVHVAAVTVNGSISVSTAASAPLEPGVVRDGEVADVEALANALRAVWADNKHLDKHVRIGIANQKIVVRVLELPPVTDRKELEAAVRFSAQDEIPMPLDSAVLDFHSLGMIETEAGPRQRVLLVAARRDMVERVLAAARAAGLRPEGVDLAAFALVRALHRRGPDDERVLYLSIGGLTNLAVAEGTDCMFTRVVGGGVEAIAVELAERRALTLEHARAWLNHVGLTDELADVEGEADIVADARSLLVDGVRRIGSDVRNTLDFHHSAGDGGERVSRAVLTGAAAAVAGFADALGTELGMPVEAAWLECVDGDLDASVVTVAAGLALEEALS
jgi:type IV pilus assembly protein PilM